MNFEVKALVKVIAVANQKGGVGKTTFAATLARLYAAEGRPVLAADVDPDANLGLALGFDEETLDSIVPISKMRKLVEERTGASANNQFYHLNPKVDDIPEKYGYKLLSGEKHTRQRDIILRICYAAELTLEQTQRALRKYEMPQLYAKIPRDALLMLIFKDRPGGIIEVNELLSKNGMEMLRTSGVQE